MLRRKKKRGGIEREFEELKFRKRKGEGKEKGKKEGKEKERMEEKERGRKKRREKGG